MAVRDRTQLDRESLWQTDSVVERGATVPLVVEGVSPNWGDDYGRKCVDYEAMGVREYWIVDFRGLGAVRYIGSPKRPTVTMFRDTDGEYVGDRFVAGDRLVSGVFPKLALAADAVFAAAG